MDKISIVIPIYNVEQYLKECVDSIIGQSYKNLEIILVDDGSTDNSGILADELSKKDDRIISLHKPNGGLSDARNYGVNYATGKYICFVDSDDYVTKDYIESMYNNLKNNNTKISACGFCHLYENGKTKEINFQNIKKLYIGDEAQIYLNIIGYYNVSSCNKLFDISLFNDLKFPVGLKSEDWYIMYKLIEKSGSIYYDSNSKYYYRQRNGSITKNSKANSDAISAARVIYDYFIDNKNVLPFAAQSLAFAIIGVYNFELCKGVKNSKLKIYKKEFNMIYKNISYKKLLFSRKLQLFLFKYFIHFYNFLFLIYNYKRQKERKQK